jgi:hypothetical protein
MTADPSQSRSKAEVVRQAQTRRGSDWRRRACASSAARSFRR